MGKWFLVSILFLTALVSGCNLRPVVETDRIETTSETIIVRDTIFKTEAANASIMASLEELKGSKKPIIRRSRNARIELQIIRDTIIAKCNCDSLEIKARLFDKFINSKVETTITETKRQSFGQQIKDSLLMMLVIVIVIGFVIKQFKT